MEKYEVLEKVAEGSYGKVYKAKVKETGKLVAIKQIRNPIDDQGFPKYTLREISLLKMLPHSIYIVKLLDMVQTEEYGMQWICLVFEYLDLDLHKYIKSHVSGSGEPEPLPPMVIKSFMYQLCKGVVHCHSHCVLHRDLKPRNLLIGTDKNILKIADFGLARGIDVDDPDRCYSQEVVTLPYRAPELLLGSPNYGFGLDMWSVGCIFAEMARMEPLFVGDSEIGQLKEIFRLMGTPTDERWPGVTSFAKWQESTQQLKPQSLAAAVPLLEPLGVDLLSKMLQYNPANRISAKEALDHPYFNDLQKSQYEEFRTESLD